MQDVHCWGELQLAQSSGHTLQLLEVISNHVPKTQSLIHVVPTISTPCALTQDVHEVGDSAQVAQIGLQDSHFPSIARKPSGHEAKHVF